MLKVKNLKSKPFLGGFFLFVLAFLALSPTLLANDDITPPLTLASFAGTLGNNGWYVSTVNTTLEALDLESGVSQTTYQVGTDPQTVKPYNTSSNLILNPSFEDLGGPSGILNWHIYETVAGGGSYSSETGEKLLGSRSAKVVSSSTGVFSWESDAGTITPITAGTYYTLYGYIKASGISGIGARFVVLGEPAGGGGLIELTTTPYSTLSSFTRLTTSFILPSGYSGVRVRASLESPGTAYFDSLSFYAGYDSQTEFTISKNGNYNFNYFSKDNSQNTENTQTVPLKIDTVAPSQWREFSLIQQQGYNDHTFDVSIRATDLVSGLYPSSAAIQYSVDDGQTWGYYSNPSSCSSSWIQDGWLMAYLNPNTPGATTGVIYRNAVDFCNSNWSQSKLLRFKIADMAGNNGISPIQALNGAWIKTTQANVGTATTIGQNGIQMTTFGVRPNSDALVHTPAPNIVNFASERNWLLPSYNASMPWKRYRDWYNEFPTTVPLPRGRLPTVNGRYLVNGNFTVDSNTIPRNYNLYAFAAVVFVKGQLTVNSNLVLNRNASLVFIVKRDVRLDKNVAQLDGFYLMDGQFDSAYNGQAPHGQLIVNGALSARGLDDDDEDEIEEEDDPVFAFRRSLAGNNNTTTPAEEIRYEPKYLVLMAPLLTTSSYNYTWSEVRP